MEAAMLDCYDLDDAAKTLLERRWFALSAKINALLDQCEVQRQVMALAEAALHDLRAQLADFEALRDALGQRLSEVGEIRQRAIASAARHALSAA
jgi:hypothetical protein